MCMINNRNSEFMLKFKSLSRKMVLLLLSLFADLELATFDHLTQLRLLVRCHDFYFSRLKAIFHHAAS